MAEPQWEESQVELLLRVGIGSVWLYDGLVTKLLALPPVLPPILAGRPAIVGDAAILLRAMGALEITLGICLIQGWILRVAALAHCGLLAAISVSLAVAVPASWLDPAGSLPKNVPLLAAGVAILFLSGTRTAGVPGADDRIPLLLRLGLGVLWLHEGLVPKWLFPSPAEVEMVARTGLVPVHIPAFLDLLGAAEAALGLGLLAGCRVRGLAALQVCLLTVLTLFVGWTSPAYLWDPLGGLAKNLGLIGCALALYQTGAGRYSLDARLARHRAWRRWRLLGMLHWVRGRSIGASEIYRVQCQAAPDPEVAETLRALWLEGGHHQEDLATLIRRHGGRPLPVAGLVRGLSWILGCLTVIPGTRAALRFDLWMMGRGLQWYARAPGLLPPEEGISGRVLQAMRDREAAQLGELRNCLRALRERTQRRR